MAMGRWTRRHLETRVQRTEWLICLGCSRPGKPVHVRRCRVFQDGVMQPGVQCPKCFRAWLEREDKGAPMARVEP